MSDFQSRYMNLQIRRKLPDLLEPLSGLLAAGVSLREAISFLDEIVTDTSMRKYLHSVRSGLDEGQPLHELGGIDGEPWLTAMLTAAELSGALGDVLATWSGQTKQHRDWIQSVGKSLAYPAVLTISALTTLVLIDVVVLPQFHSMYRQLGMRPSRVTQDWMGIVNHLPECALGLGIITAASTGALLFLKRMHPQVWWEIRRKTPGYRLWRLFRTQQFAFLLGMLIRAGVPLMDALETSRSTGPKWIQARAGLIAQRVLAGQTLSEVFDGDWDPVLHLQVRMAELSGQLGEALLHADVYARAELQRQVSRGLKRLEPVLTLITGGVIGLTMLSLYAPMYSMMSTLGQ